MSVQRVLERSTTHPRHRRRSPARSGPLWHALRLPARRAMWLGGVGLLEPPVRRRLGLAWGALDEAQFRLLSTTTWLAGPLMPESLKATGPGHLRWRAVEIESGPLGHAA